MARQVISLDNGKVLFLVGDVPNQEIIRKIVKYGDAQGWDMGDDYEMWELESVLATFRLTLVDIFPMKLIRSKIVQKLKEGEWEIIPEDRKDQLNELYELKILEELEEVKNSNHKDISEFADLFEVVLAYGRMNGHPLNKIVEAMKIKRDAIGGFGNVVLNNLNPDNPSNKLYFDRHGR